MYHGRIADLWFARFSSVELLYGRGRNGFSERGAIDVVVVVCEKDSLWSVLALCDA
jgi:hypothetical protein